MPTYSGVLEVESRSPSQRVGARNSRSKVLLCCILAVAVGLTLWFVEFRTSQATVAADGDFDVMYVISLARHGVKASTSYPFERILANKSDPLSVACQTPPDVAACNAHLAEEFSGDAARTEVLGDVLPAGEEMTANMAKWMRSVYVGNLLNDKVMLISSPAPRTMNTALRWLQAYRAQAQDQKPDALSRKDVFATKWANEYNYISKGSAYNFDIAALTRDRSLTELPDGAHFKAVLRTVVFNLFGVVAPQQGTDDELTYAMDVCKIAQHLMNEYQGLAAPEGGRFSDYARLLANKKWPPEMRLRRIDEAYSICSKYFLWFANKDNLAQTGLPLLSLILALIAHRVQDGPEVQDFLANVEIDKDQPVFSDDGAALVYVSSHDIMVSFLRIALGVTWDKYSDGQRMTFANSPTYNMQITFEAGLSRKCTNNLRTSDGDNTDCFMVRAWTFSPSASQYPQLAVDSNNLTRKYVRMFGSAQAEMPWNDFKAKLASFILSSAGGPDSYL